MERKGKSWKARAPKNFLERLFFGHKQMSCLPAPSKNAQNFKGKTKGKRRVLSKTRMKGGMGDCEGEG